jgi:hypothetical protein
MGAQELRKEKRKSRKRERDAGERGAILKKENRLPSEGRRGVIGAEDSALAKGVEVGIGGKFAAPKFGQSFHLCDPLAVIQFRKNLAGGFRTERKGEPLTEESISIGRS